MANFTYAVSVLIEPDDSMDFNTKLLGMFMLNQFIYSIFYVVMKMCKREWTFAFHRIHPLLYLLVALAFWIPGVFFFLQKAAKWEVLYIFNTSTHCHDEDDDDDDVEKEKKQRKIRQR